MQLYKKKLLFITVCLLLGCSAIGQKKRTFTPYQTTTNIQNHVLSTDSLINELKGCWHPILYTIADVYARDTSEVEKLMKKDICIGTDTAVIFTDTIFSIKINHVEQSSKVDWIFYNIDPDKRAVYNILGSKIWDITLDCSMKSTPNSFSTFRTTANFAYDGKYLYYGEDGFNFLLIKNSSNVKKYFGSGSSVKAFTLTGKEHTLNLSYKFYTDPDEIIVYDQSGKELYHSRMTSTKQIKNATIKLKNTTKLTVKIVSKNPASRWVFWFDTK